MPHALSCPIPPSPHPPPPTKHFSAKTIRIRAWMIATIKNLPTLILPARLALLVIACGDEPGPYCIGAEADGVVLFSGLAGNPDIANAL